MGYYTFNKKYITKSTDFIIEAIKTKLKEESFFIGIGQGKRFDVNRMSTTAIYYMANDKKQNKVEDMDIEEMKTVLVEMKKLPKFNSDTDLLKERISTAMYRKRTPLFGMLKQTEIILDVEE